MTLRGESEKALLIGGHIDSVPNGGWLDGCSQHAGGSGDSAADQRRNPTASRRSRCAWSIGPTRKARVSGKVFSVRRPARAISTWMKRAACTTRTAFRLPDALKEQGIDFEKVKDSGRELANARGLSRAAHRTGTGAARSRPAVRRGPRHFRRRAARDHVFTDRQRTPGARR